MTTLINWMLNTRRKKSAEMISSDSGDRYDF